MGNEFGSPDLPGGGNHVRYTPEQRTLITQPGTPEGPAARTDASSGFVESQTGQWLRRLARVGVAAATVTTVAAIVAEGIIFPPSVAVTGPIIGKIFTAAIATEALIGGAALTAALGPPDRKPGRSKMQAPKRTKS